MAHGALAKLLPLLGGTAAAAWPIVAVIAALVSAYKILD